MGIQKLNKSDNGVPLFPPLLHKSSYTASTSNVEFLNINGKGYLHHLAAFHSVTFTYMEVYVDGALIFNGTGRAGKVNGIINYRLLSGDAAGIRAQGVDINNGALYSLSVSDSAQTFAGTIPSTSALPYSVLLIDPIKFNSNLTIKYRTANGSYGVSMLAYYTLE